MKKNFLLFLLLFSTFMVGCSVSSNRSANNYLLESKKNAYIDVALSFVSSVRTKVNEGKQLLIYDTEVLYMIPVGNESSKTCVNDSYTRSPFSDTWNFAFVGVRYVGDGYNYYYISEDGEGYGITFASQKKLLDSKNIVNEDGIDKELSTYLKEKYNEANNRKLNLSTMDKKMIESYDELSDVKKIEYIVAPDCKNDINY